MSLYHKYRPVSLNEIIGNTSVVNSINGFISKNEVPHSILFHGPTGCGKTTLARILANQLDCGEFDLTEIDSAQFRGIDTVRDIRKNCQFVPINGNVKVYIIDEVHKMTGDAQNAFLKVLEDTPNHVYFFLCTTEPQKLLPTIRGRCTQFQVNLLQDHEMIRLLQFVAKLEGKSKGMANEIYEQIITDSQGHPRNALQILEKVLSVPKEERLEMAKQAQFEESQSIDLCRAIINKAGWGKVKEILNGLKGQEAETVRRVMLGYATSVLLGNGKSAQMEIAAFVIEQLFDPLYDVGFPGLVGRCYVIVNG